jgi:ribosomal protein S18 acetylase RimI-like enzyme
MSSYWVRPATPLDGKAVRDLARRVVREFRLAARWPDPPALADGQDFMWVVEAGRGEIVGSCGLRETPAGAWELHSLYLAPEFRGFGLGRSLVENALLVARRHGAPAVVFGAPAEFHEAQSLVRRLGFTEAGTGEAGGARRYRLVLAGLA